MAERVCVLEERLVILGERLVVLGERLLVLRERPVIMLLTEGARFQRSSPRASIPRPRNAFRRFRVGHRVRRSEPLVVVIVVIVIVVAVVATVIPMIIAIAIQVLLGEQYVRFTVPIQWERIV